MVRKLNKRDNKKKVKNISTLDIATLYQTVIINLLIKVSCEITKFVLKSKTRSRIGFLKTSIYVTSKGCRRRYLARQTLIDVISFLITKCNFTNGNLVFKQEIDIPMGIDQALYWAHLFFFSLNLNIFSNSYLKDLHVTITSMVH